MITADQIQKALREKGFDLATATRDSSAIQFVTEVIAREVPPLVQQAGISISQAATNPEILEKAATFVHGKIPIPWKWVVGKKRTAQIVRRIAEGVSNIAPSKGPPMKNKICPACKNQMAADANFCDECGTALGIATPSSCPNCGSAIDEQVKFCGRCATSTIAEVLSEPEAASAFGQTDSALQRRPIDLFNDAPKEFLEAAFFMTIEDWPGGERAMSRVFSDPDWDVVARCCYAYCLMQQGRHDEAITSAQTIASEAIPLPGRWYRYMTLTACLNMKDDLPAALAIADEAIAYFEEANMPMALVGFLPQKTNILKQQCSTLSRNIARHNEARPRVIEAIRCACLDRELCTSFDTSNGEIDSQQGEEIKALARIAARLGLKPADLAFLDQIQGIEDWKNKYFTAGGLEGQAAAESWNMAIEALQEDDREGALPWYQRAYDLVGEKTPGDRAFKALAAYQYGVCLLKLNGLEDVPLSEVPSGKSDIVVRIRTLWKKTIELHASLDDATRHADEETINGIRKALLRDPLMRGQMLALAGLGLANGAERQKAAETLVRSLEHLDRRYDEDRGWIVAVHERLASLLRDIGNARDAATHAHWILANVSNLDSAVRSTMLQISQGGAGSTAQDARIRLNALLELYPSHLRILKGEGDVDRLDVTNIEMKGPFDNNDPEFTSFLKKALESGLQVAVSAAGPKQVLALVSRPGKRIFRDR